MTSTVDTKINSMDIELSGSCNYKCKMCPHDEPGREPEFLRNLPFDLFTNIIDQAVELGVKNIRLHGSGEPTLYKRLVDAVQYCSDKNLNTLITTNGARLTPKLSQQLCDAGLTELTVSVIGSNKESYLKWMGEDNFDLIRNNIKTYNDLSQRPANLYHLITDPDRENEEIQEYKSNWEDYTQSTSEIWKMHNWSGVWDNQIFLRKKSEQRSCGRMFQPVVEVRAGGIDGHQGAVVACCMVLGNDSQAVLGHLDSESLIDIWNGPARKKLQEYHNAGRWNEIDYCKNCDQLYDNPESLVYTSKSGRKYNQIKF